jgi:hypothetical protein
MKDLNTLKLPGLIACFLVAILALTGCSKKDEVTPAAPELAIVGKWQHMISKRSENGKVVYEYVGTPADYMEITTNDIIDFMDGAKSAYTYKVIEKNKKISIIGSGLNGANEVIEIRNLSKTAMTFYQERVVNNNKYIWYIDFKKQ